MKKVLQQQHNLDIQYISEYVQAEEVLEKTTCILHKLRVNSTDSATANLNFISHIEIDMCGVAVFSARALSVYFVFSNFVFS